MLKYPSVCKGASLKSFFPLLFITYLALGNSFIFAQEKGKVTPQAIFTQNCFDCHDNEKQKGNINFEKQLEVFKTEKNMENWVKTWDVLKNDLMPPPHKKQLTSAEKETLVSWIQKEAFKYDPLKPNPGKAVIRRLNREEYNNTINDLFGLSLELNEEFPPDDTGYGFDNIGSVLTTSPLLLEKYLGAADQVLERLFPDENPKVTKKNIPLNLFKGNHFPTGGSEITMIYNYEINYTDDIIYDGEYEYTILAAGDQAGPELVKMKAGVKQVQMQEFTVPNNRTSKSSHKLKLKLTPGDHSFVIGFINDYYKPDDPDPRKRDSNLVLYSLVREGPFNPSKTQKSAFEIKWLAELESEKVPQNYARKFLTKFLPKAYRRNISEEEITAKIKFFSNIYSQTNSLKESLKWTIQSILISPHFLFKDETFAKPIQNAADVFLINEFSLASKLSYWLWSSMPDDQLLDLAKNNQLRKNLNAEIVRMLKSPKVKTMSKNFLGQWLQLRNLDFKSVSFTDFPRFNRALIGDSRIETEEYFQYIISEDRSILELLDSNYAFLNQRLAEHYEIPNVKGSQFRKVELTDKRRGGLLTQASVLLVTSYPTRTSLVLRGKYVLENFLGFTPPNPPPEMPSLADKEESKDKTLRERIQMHAANETCASCHSKFDPMGYALENFDGVGKWRTEEKGKPLDTKGTLLTGESFDGVAELKEVLVKNKKDLFAKCLIKKLMTYALGRGLQYYDEVEIENILKATIKHNYQFSEMIIAIANSTPFQKQRAKDE